MGEVDQLYLEIAESLIQQIHSGCYREYEKIPSENQLCRRFKTNRHTVRMAIARMTNQGWITPVQGKGSFVKKRGLTRLRIFYLHKLALLKIWKNKGSLTRGNCCTGTRLSRTRKREANWIYWMGKKCISLRFCD